ncbi:MAG TPA: hypothetical protein VHM25_26565 [Polyangiaceae bacterium]|jgi:hypothetical protein|nr:hypothetical protein [Polyangiaceae bacterium]
MTDPNNAQSAATQSAASLSRRLHRLMVVVVTVLFGATLSGLSLAASTQSHPERSATKPKTAANHSSTHPTTSSPKAKSKPKTATAQRPTQPRKTATKTRLAAKSKTPTRAHQSPRKPAKLATKQAKHAA